MRIAMLFLLTVTLAGAAMGAGNAPLVIRAGIYPLSIKGGDQFTIYAEISDADGLGAVQTVGLVYDDQLVYELPQSAQQGIYYQTFTAPADCPSGVFPMFIGAVDNTLNVSNLIHFVFSVLPVGGDPVVLTSPENGAKFDCTEAPTFAWEAYPAAVGYVFEIYLPFGISAAITLPAEITTIPVPLVLWPLIPEGSYSWRVGAIMSEGAPAEHYSELWTFVKDCNGGPPAQFDARIMAIDPATQILNVHMERDESCILAVAVTDQTAITDEAGNVLSFGDLAVGMKVGITGTPGSDPNAPFVASEIVVYSEQPPARVVGAIASIDAEKMLLVITEREGGAEVTVQVTSDTKIFGMHHEELQFSDLVVGMIAMVRGELQGEVIVAAEIRVFDDTPPPPPPVLAGTIANIEPDKMMLYIDPRCWGHDLVGVQVNSNTNIHDVLGNPLTFDDLAIDMFVLVVGEIQNDVIVAIEITVQNETPPPPPGVIDGMIAEIIADKLQLSVMTHGQDQLIVQVTEHTIITDVMGNPLTFDDFQVRQFIHATGEMSDDVFTADAITVFDFSPPPPSDRIDGVIQSIDAENWQLSVLSNALSSDLVTIQVSRNTVITADDGRMLAFSDLQVDMHILALGTWDNNLFMANVITVFGTQPPPPPGDVSGIISAIDPNAMQLVVTTRASHSEPSRTFVIQVSENTAITDMNGNELTFGDLAVGFLIQAQGSWDNDIFAADSITVFNFEPPPPPPEQIQGAIVEINADALQFSVQGWNENRLYTVQVLDSTIIVDLMGNSMTFDELQVGFTVRVDGSWANDVFTATNITVFNYEPPPPPAQITGVITAINAYHMQLTVMTANEPTPTTVQVTEHTVITDDQGNELAFGDLAVGDQIDAAGSLEHTIFVADTITVHGTQPPPPPPQEQINGRIIEIDPASLSFVVQTGWGQHGEQVTVQVTDQTSITDMNGNEISFDDLQPNDMIMGLGNYQDTVFIAQSIMVFRI